MSEREKKALKEIASMVNERDEEGQAMAAAILAAYDAGKVAGEKKAAPVA